ncbi:hypothetical protein N431DRAFT_481515 [Stipitochalara longipes BDJ]|nr:hypothetical protein N431DRAFT_481515 [Stipitochalara longipes BDJ]
MASSAPSTCLKFHPVSKGRTLKIFAPHSTAEQISILTVAQAILERRAIGACFPYAHDLSGGGTMSDGETLNDNVTSGGESGNAEARSDGDEILNGGARSAVENERAGARSDDLNGSVRSSC